MIINDFPPQKGKQSDIIYFIMNVHKTTYKAILNKNPNLKLNNPLDLTINFNKL